MEKFEVGPFGVARVTALASGSWHAYVMFYSPISSACLSL